ncbi:unnamed protein product [Cyprideis torosa]|uniref:Uncharacterized protein n=1 Tax=Cyprideis torosa TaxID=163714 RepID=A0A7R8ZPB3_9CRUS|nr:unnamed protein product [Cyprideis torosa]CAG0888051.1 unnamed protein product [Cyprideis torosa]
MTTSTKEAEPKVEAAKDPGAFQPCHPYYGEKDFEGHRAHSMYVGVPVRNRRNHHRRHGRGHRRKTNEKEGDKEDDKPGTPPSQRVHFILGEDDDDGSVHPIFSEMIELYTHDDGDMEWRETARFVCSCCLWK